MRSSRIAFPTLCIALTVLAVMPTARACTRILWNDNGLAVVVARTMDWPESTEPVLTVFPRGIKRDGGRLGPVEVVKENPIQWSSKYGSLVTTVYGVGAADGVNERGLAAHMLYLQATEFAPRDASRPGLHAGLWAQYLLDNAATVDEALQSLDDFQLVMVETRGRKTTVHLAIEDAKGDSAIIEYIDGRRIVHHGRAFRIMTNDPTYDHQLALLKKQDFSNPSSETPLPGNVSPVDRFQRASYFSAMLPKPKDARQAVAAVLAIARNVSVPFGAPYRKFGVYNTEYRTVADLTNRRYFFELSTTPNVVWIDLAKLNLASGAPVLILDPDDVDLSGEVSGKLKQAPDAPF